MAFNANEMKKLGEDIASSYDIRVSAVGDIIKETKSTLRNFHTERRHMSEELHSELEHFCKELADMTGKMLNGFHKEHKEMASEMREGLSKFHHRIYADTHKFLKEFKTSFLKAQDQFHNMLSSYYKGEIQKPVKEMLGRYDREMRAMANDFSKAHEAWMSFARSMSAKKGIKKPPAKRMSKADMICAILEMHPKGMTKTAMAKEMHCSSKSLTPPLNSLKKKGRISKKQSKFFPK